ncbi:MAG TPA: hypothetical protein PLY23_07210, partial [Alphaproteobacteria bacterium]|nr:hypothetical protein [Alphaproteobacteria bacterium]HQS94491.1 hypothetical protein [Alphaproteobacteria bacterium]
MFKISFFFLAFFSFTYENLYGLEIEWSSNHEGFSKVRWNGLSYDSKKEEETLSFIKAASSLYQGVEGQESTFNASPNFATLTLGIVVKTPEKKHVFHYPLKNEENKIIIFSSSNRGVYAKDLLSEVAEYLKIPSDWCIYSYGDLYKYSASSLLRQRSEGDKDKLVEEPITRTPPHLEPIV